MSFAEGVLAQAARRATPATIQADTRIPNPVGLVVMVEILVPTWGRVAVDVVGVAIGADRGVIDFTESRQVAEDVSGKVAERIGLR